MASNPPGYQARGLTLLASPCSCPCPSPPWQHLLSAPFQALSCDFLPTIVPQHVPLPRLFLPPRPSHFQSLSGVSQGSDPKRKGPESERHSSGQGFLMQQRMAQHEFRSAAMRRLEPQAPEMVPVDCQQLHHRTVAQAWNFSRAHTRGLCALGLASSLSGDLPILSVFQPLKMRPYQPCPIYSPTPPSHLAPPVPAPYSTLVALASRLGGGRSPRSPSLQSEKRFEQYICCQWQ